MEVVNGVIRNLERVNRNISGVNKTKRGVNRIGVLGLSRTDNIIIFNQLKKKGWFDIFAMWILMILMINFFDWKSILSRLM